MGFAAIRLVTSHAGHVDFRQLWASAHQRPMAVNATMGSFVPTRIVVLKGCAPEARETVLHRIPSVPRQSVMKRPASVCSRSPRIGVRLKTSAMTGGYLTLSLHASSVLRKQPGGTGVSWPTLATLVTTVTPRVKQLMKSVKSAIPSILRNRHQLPIAPNAMTVTSAQLTISVPGVPVHPHQRIAATICPAPLTHAMGTMAVAAALLCRDGASSTTSASRKELFRRKERTQVVWLAYRQSASLRGLPQQKVRTVRT